MKNQPNQSLPICIALIAGAGTLPALAAPAMIDPGQVRTASPHGAVYINIGTSERIISLHNPDASHTPTHANRGEAWSWSNTVLDPCAPDPEGFLVSSIFNGLHDDQPDVPTQAIKYWQDWFEHPGDTIVNGVTFNYFSQIPDAGEDGVAGLDLILVFTENDSPTTRSAAIAHSPIIIGDLLGAADDGAGGDAIPGDGIIDFTEGNLWTVFLDLDGCDECNPVCDGIDIEIGDTNGVSDSMLGEAAVFSGVPGADTDGDGLINSGFVVGFRQPNVAEGDGLIARFPELAGSGIENPDGLNPASFANTRPMGNALAAPSANTASYQGGLPGANEWPLNPSYTPLPGEGVGAIDGFAWIDALGVDLGFFAFGGFACDPNATEPPYTINPWSGWSIAFNTPPFTVVCPSGCNAADIAEPYETLDLADITAFIGAFIATDPLADIDTNGIWDLADITAFITAFQAGCP